MNRAARNDLIFGSTVLGLALLMLFVGIPIGIESPGDVDILALAPTFWPNIIMALLALIGIIMVISSMMLLRAPEQADKDSEDQSYGPALAITRVIACIVVMFIYQALLEPLGFVAASMLAIIVLTVLGGERRAYVVLPVAILVPLGLFGSSRLRPACRSPWAISRAGLHD